MENKKKLINIFWKDKENKRTNVWTMGNFKFCAYTGKEVCVEDYILKLINRYYTVIKHEDNNYLLAEVSNLFNAILDREEEINSTTAECINCKIRKGILVAEEKDGCIWLARK